MPRAALKEIISAAAGIGEHGIRQWLHKHNLKELPPAVEGFIDDLRVAASADFDAHPSMVAKLRTLVKDDQSIKNKLTYALNAQYERRQLKSACEVLKNVAIVRSYEYDGLVVTPSRGKATVAWLSSVMALVEPLGFACKEYRTVAELLEVLAARHSYIPDCVRGLTFDEHEEFYARFCELYKRLKAGERPTLRAAALLPSILVKPSRAGGGLAQALGDVYKAAPGKDGKSVYYTFTPTRLGGFWKELHGKDYLRVEEHLVEAMCNIVGLQEKYAPKDWVAGPFTSAIMSRIEGELYDADFLTDLDGEGTRDKLMFACGQYWDLNTFELKMGKPTIHMSRHTGYSFPVKEMEELEAKLTVAGIDVEGIFARVREWEKLPGGARQYTQSIIDDLQKIAEIEEFEIFKMLHDSFTFRGDDGEKPGGFWVAIYRGLKLLVAAMKCADEVFVMDLGTMGENGKGFLWNVVKGLFGMLAAELPLQLVTRDPPSAEAPSPLLFSLRNVRFLGTPETEAGVTLRSSWMKMLGDPSTVYTGRGLRMDTVRFHIPCIFFCSTNVALEFSSVEGGIRRRAIGVDWPVTFTSNAVDNCERPKHAENIKHKAWYTPKRLAGHLLLLRACAKVWFKDNSRGLFPQPPQIKEATESMLESEAMGIIAEFMADAEKLGTTVAAGKDATTELKAKQALRAYLQRDYPKADEKVFMKALHSMVFFKAPVGSTKRIQCQKTKQWLKLV